MRSLQWKTLLFYIYFTWLFVYTFPPKVQVKYFLYEPIVAYDPKWYSLVLSRTMTWHLQEMFMGFNAWSIHPQHLLCHTCVAGGMILGSQVRSHRALMLVQAELDLGSPCTNNKKAAPMAGSPPQMRGPQTWGHPMNPWDLLAPGLYETPGAGRQQLPWSPSLKSMWNPWVWEITAAVISQPWRAWNPWGWEIVVATVCCPGSSMMPQGAETTVAMISLPWGLQAPPGLGDYSCTPWLFRPNSIQVPGGVLPRPRICSCRTWALADTGCCWDPELVAAGTEVPLSCRTPSPSCAQCTSVSGRPVSWRGSHPHRRPWYMWNWKLNSNQL